MFALRVVNYLAAEIKVHLFSKLGIVEEEAATGALMVTAD